MSDPRTWVDEPADDKVTDVEVEVAWRTYEGIAPETFVMGHYIGKARKRMRAALEAARKVKP